ncbi:MAG TPA: hypothetical protein VGA85_07050 [Dehalococcoidales bacterium]
MDDKQVSSSELSTSNLAKQLKMSTKAMFQLLVDTGLISRNGDTWDLTPIGESKGGTYRQHKEYGRYIVWPPSILSELDDSQGKQGQNLITATSIGEFHKISANRINSILSELGWIKRDTAINGWQVTDFGKKVGGVQSTFKNTGVPYVRWPQNILENKALITSIDEAKGDVTTVTQNQVETTITNDTDIRNNYQKPELRTQDGHYVRSKAEVLIDNWLYVSKIVHAYERKVPNIDEDILCDFYIPTGKVFIEYWGLDDEKYLAKKKWKLDIYKKNNINLIELTEKDVSNLDDKLAAKLRKFHVLVE